LRRERRDTKSRGGTKKKDTFYTVEGEGEGIGTKEKESPQKRKGGTCVAGHGSRPGKIEKKKQEPSKTKP